MKERIHDKKTEINYQKKNIRGEAPILVYIGKADIYSVGPKAQSVEINKTGEASLKKSEAIFSFTSQEKASFAIHQKKMSVANYDRLKVIKAFEKNSLSGERTYSRKESAQRAILKSEYEKEYKRELIKGDKSTYKRLTPLVPYYQIQTCSFDNSHFAKVMVLCSCNDHINCGVCRLKRMIRLQKKYLPVMQEFKNAKMLTLTMKRTGNLKHDFERLNKCISRLKKTKAWKGKVRYYFGSKEVVENNIHVHIIIESKFWTQDEISKLWKEITGTDFIVDIRKLKNPEKAIKEVFKYIVKDAKKELLAEVSNFRKENPHFRWIFSSKNLASLVDESESNCEAIDEALILSALEADTSLDTIAISGRRGCPCCSSDLILVGDFKTKEEAEAERQRILSGNQYRNPRRT